MTSALSRLCAGVARALVRDVHVAQGVDVDAHGEPTSAFAAAAITVPPVPVPAIVEIVLLVDARMR